MSRTYDIACVRCKKALWIGQSSVVSPPGYIYATSASALEVFLFEHKGHELRFDLDSAFEGYEEIEA